MHSICPAGREWIYIISNLPLGKYIDFSVRKNIELRSNISTKNHPKKFFFFGWFVLYRYKQEVYVSISVSFVKFCPYETGSLSEPAFRFLFFSAANGNTP